MASPRSVTFLSKTCSYPVIYANKFHHKDSKYIYNYCPLLMGKIVVGGNDKDIVKYRNKKTKIKKK
jgi:hypothetical protein